MPLYEYKCPACNAREEKLMNASERSDVHRCSSCDADMERITASRFGVAGTKPRTSEASLGSSGAEFMSNPDKFVTAMDTFGEKVGSQLTPTQKERAVERLKDAKK